MKLFLFQKYFKTEHKFAKRSLYYEKQQSFIVSTNFVLLCLLLPSSKIKSIETILSEKVTHLNRRCYDQMFFRCSIDYLHRLRT